MKQPHTQHFILSQQEWGVHQIVYFCTSVGLLDLSETKWVDVSFIKCIRYSFFFFFKEHHIILSLSYTWHDCWFDIFTMQSALQCVSNRWEMWNPRWDMHAALWNDAPGGKHKQMFATKHVQITPPPFIARPPPLSKKPQPHMWHITSKAENMFLELNYYEASKQDKFPNWLLSQHLHIALFFPRRWVPLVCWVWCRSVPWR